MKLTVRIWVFGVCYLLNCNVWRLGEAYILLRHRREATEGGGENDVHNQGSYSAAAPENQHPYPAIGSQNMAPSFPFMHTFQNGLDVNKGDITDMTGHLNIPIPGWGMWDLKGHQTFGPSHVWYNYGHLISPVNPYHLSPQTMADMAANPNPASNLEAKDDSSPQKQAVPVVRLPGGFTPAECVPPMCNPFMHAVDFGTQVEPGDRKTYDGALDFPYQAKDGTIKRFPLSGGFNSGPQPISVLYGQNMNPVNPFPKGTLNRQQQQQQQQQAPQASSTSNSGTGSASTATDTVQHDSTGKNHPAFKPFVIPLANDQARDYVPTNNAAHSNSNNNGYFHGNHNLVMPPPIPST